MSLPSSYSFSSLCLASEISTYLSDCLNSSISELADLRFYLVWDSLASNGAWIIMLLASARAVDLALRLGSGDVAKSIQVFIDVQIINNY